MRKQYFKWSWFVLGLVLSVYGAFSLIYNHTHNKDFSILGLVFLIVGLILLVSYFTLLTISVIQDNKSKKIKKTIVEQPKEIKIEQPEKIKVESKPVKKEEKPTTNRDVSYSQSNKPVRSTREFNGGSGYVKLIGEGPIIRISEQEILDMRTNTYYRIEDNYVKQMGYGPVFELVGNRIKLAYGGYLFELSGSNINKVYGGFFASISGGFLKTYDLSQNYEIPTSLNKSQILAVVALLFKA